MIGLIILSAPIVTSLFMYGSFDYYDMSMTALSLITYSLGLPAFIFMKILVTAFYSRQDTKTPVIYSLYGISLNILANITVLYLYLNSPFDSAHALVALATSLSAWVQVILMSYKLKKLSILKSNIFCDMVSFKIIISSVIMALILFFYLNPSEVTDELTAYMRISYLIFYIVIGAVVYYASLRLLGLKLRNFKL